MRHRNLLPLLILVGCFARKEAVEVQSSLDVKTSLDVVERVFATSGYPPVSEDDVEPGREVVHSQWRDYPPNHAGHGPFQRRPVAIIGPAKVGTNIELRFDVVKCVHSGSEPRCDAVDLLFESDKKELDVLKSRLETALRTTGQAANVTTSSAAAEGALFSGSPGK